MQHPDRYGDNISNRGPGWHMDQAGAWVPDTQPILTQPLLQSRWAVGTRIATYVKVGWWWWWHTHKKSCRAGELALTLPLNPNPNPNLQGRWWCLHGATPQVSRAPIWLHSEHRAERPPQHRARSNGERRASNQVTPTPARGLASPKPDRNPPHT